MQAKEFNELVEKRKARISLILEAKATEYARGDRLSNFKEVASFNHCTPERALWGMVSKHIMAMRDFIEDLDEGRCASEEQWDEKLGDIINYMILFEGLLEDRRNSLPLDTRPMQVRVSEALTEMFPAKFGNPPGDEVLF